MPKEWNDKTYQEYINYLESLSEQTYKDFQSKLTFTKYEMLGIRIPLLRKIAKQISKSDIISFLICSKNKYYEEIMINGFIISNIDNEAIFDKYFMKHIKLIDDWSLCDSFCNSLKIVKKNKDKYFKICVELAKSEEEFISRVGLITILSHFIEPDNIEEIFNLLNEISTNKYYINMAEAWLVCELYVKFPNLTQKFILKNNLNNFTHNKAISKIRESYRVSKEEKEFLTTLKRK